jgi:hypothetical protein
MESYAKYAVMPRTQTCLLIDEPAVVVLGRTFLELVATVVSFLVVAFLDTPWSGLAVAIVFGWLIPMVRMRFPRGFVRHLGWSLGVWFPEVGMFSLSRMTRILGP